MPGRAVRRRRTPSGMNSAPASSRAWRTPSEGTGRDPIALPSSLETADGHHGDAGALGKFGLFETQQGTGGADLFRGNLHERKISDKSAFVQGEGWALRGSRGKPGASV